MEGKNITQGMLFDELQEINKHLDQMQEMNKKLGIISDLLHGWHLEWLSFMKRVQDTSLMFEKSPETCEQKSSERIPREVHLHLG